MKYFFIFLMALNALFFSVNAISEPLEVYRGKHDNLQKKIAPYLLPQNHPLYETLSSIFTSSKVIDSDESLVKAGFYIMTITPMSYVRLAFHPSVPGYIFKIYVNSDNRTKDDRPGWEWLLDRCIGAANIRNLIAREKLKYFCVPDKWLFQIPSTDKKRLKQPVVLIAQYMSLVSPQENDYAWKYIITKDHLRELYTILSNGFASSYVGPNIPYCQNGLFACIDTEYPKRKIKLQTVKKFLSEEMKMYWDMLVKTNGRTG